MPGPNLQGSFTTGSVASTGGVASDILNPPTGMTTAKLTLIGLDGSNTVKTQKRTAGGAFVDQTTYSSNQSAVNVTVASTEEWRIVLLTAQPIKTLAFKFSCES